MMGSFTTEQDPKYKKSKRDFRKNSLAKEFPLDVKKKHLKEFVNAGKKKPYIRKIAERGKYKIREVNGFYVRNHINVEFTNFGSKLEIPEIPENEIWLDKEMDKNDYKYYIHNMLLRNVLVDNDIPYDVAFDVSTMTELVQRKEERNEKQKDKIYLMDIGKLKVYLVNSAWVRKTYYIHFTEGGHHYVYKWVPKMEVWMDDDLTFKDFPFVLLHELYERRRMKKGEEYHPAHKKASAMELKMRKAMEDIEDIDKFE
jgi:hypothetical protein